MFNSQVPYDVLNKKFRLAQKTLDREVCHVTTAVSELERILFTADNHAASHISSLLGGVVEKLSSFKRKVCVCVCLSCIFALFQQQAMLLCLMYFFSSGYLLNCWAWFFRKQ